VKSNYHLVVLLWISQGLLWIAFADNSGIREIAIGAVVTGMATLAVWRFRRHTHDRYKLRFEYVRQAIHIPKSILVDTWILLRVIVMRLMGKTIPARIIGVPFKIGGNGPASRGRRSLAITFLTLTPNTLVLGLLPDEQLLLIHTLIPQPPPAFMFRLGTELDDAGRAHK
jgi:multisubunit Na+/H+ antiporter MnhE subunit